MTEEVNQADATKQAEDLAVKGWASIPGYPQDHGVWMVREGTMRDWRGHLDGAKSHLSVVIREYLTPGADMRVSKALVELEILLSEMPGEAQ